MKISNANVNGDNNTVIQNSGNLKMKNDSRKSVKSKGEIITIILTLIGVVVAIIVGWDKIIQFLHTLWK